MVRREDFKIEIGSAPNGAYVRVVHLPTAMERRSDGIQDGRVREVRDRLLRELPAELYSRSDFETRIVRAEGGDFLQVLHRLSGKSRFVHHLGQRNQHRLIEDMIDSILEELAREAVKTK